MNWLNKLFKKEQQQPNGEQEPAPVSLTQQEREELKLRKILINQKEAELELMKHGLQNILNGYCKRFGFDEEKAIYNFELGVLKHDGSTDTKSTNT